MEGSTGYLTTIAEVAIALAGFSALVALLAVRAGRSDPRADAARLQIMLETSLLVVAFALFPFVPSRLGASSDLLWRISGGAFLIADATYWILTFKRYQAIGGLLTTTSDRRFTVSMRLSAVTVDLLMVVVVLGLARSAAPGLYFAGLYLELVVSGAFFVSFAASMLAPHD